jgi:hypothetical protein
MKKILPLSLLLLFVFFGGTLLAQTELDGDALISFLGKTANSEEVSLLKSKYNIEKINEAHYLSKNGIELIFKGATLAEISLYNNSSVYGSFTAKLPHNLRFGMSSGEVKTLLGKPTESYSNGYSEFELQGCTYSCWFEGGKLTQVGLSAK